MSIGRVVFNVVLHSIHKWETIESWQKTVSLVFVLPLHHMSCFQPKPGLEPGTPFSQKDVNPPSIHNSRSSGIWTHVISPPKRVTLRPRSNQTSLHSGRWDRGRTCVVLFPKQVPEPLGYSPISLVYLQLPRLSSQQTHHGTSSCSKRREPTLSPVSTQHQTCWI